MSELREETALMPNAGMQIAPEQGQFMAMLTKILGVKRYLEVGVFTGYSSLSVALAMPPDGSVVACDVSEEFTSVARRYWERAGVSSRIKLIIAPATETLLSLEPGFDLMFIDADKVSYRHYYEAGLRLLRTGGVMLIDNVFWSGAVANPEHTDSDTEALRQLNAFIHSDDRVDLAILPIGDGLTMVRKR
jgi:caffeoyl-CoA O-methyltransferase